MLPRISLLEELRKGGYEASLTTTYNAYLPFYEDVVLRRLINAGVRHNVLMMDRHQYAASISHDPPRQAGRRYTLIPVQVGGAFHPKLIFLFGKSKGLIAIGSHNLTLAGFGFNRELTNLIKVPGNQDADARELAGQVWKAALGWLDLASAQVPASLIEMGRRVADFAPWLAEPATGESSDSAYILSGQPNGATLWSQLKNLIQGSVRRVVVTGAFFDQKLTFIARLQEELQPDAIYLAVEPETVDLPPLAAQMPGVSVVRADQLGQEQTEAKPRASGYLHAKGLFIEGVTGDAVFVTGSANPSYPAWFADDAAGNVEIALARIGQSALTAAKETGFLDIPDMPELTNEDWKTVKTRSQSQDAPANPTLRTGVAVASAGEIAVRRNDLADISFNTATLLDELYQDVVLNVELQSEKDQFVVRAPEKLIERASFLRFLHDGEIGAVFLVHHTAMIEAQAQTGIQRKFRDALCSLETDSPDLATLIQCVERIIFGDDTETKDKAIR